LESPSARNRLKRGRQPHWKALVEGKMHLGWQRWKGDDAGRWLLRRYIGNYKYRVQALGRADDAVRADGVNVLDFAQAEDKARRMITGPEGVDNGKIERITVRQAMARYSAFKEQNGQPVADLLSRSTVHILPSLGDLVVAELTAEVLRKWLATMAAAPAQSRPKDGKPRFKAAPTTEEGTRARRASANRVLTMLKAALNHAYDEGHVANRDAWGRKFKPFRDAESARLRYLEIGEAKRLVNAADPDFRLLVQAALLTGARYGQLAALIAADFNADAGTVRMVTRKGAGSKKVYHVHLTAEGARFFKQACLGRAGDDLLFSKADGSAWQKSEQSRPMIEACQHARITPALGFHQLRHTWASHAVMNGVPLLVVAKNLGHTDTRMVEKHYGHLGRDYIADAIRDGAPRYGIVASKRVVPLR
jgi:integrase